MTALGQTTFEGTPGEPAVSGLEPSSPPALQQPHSLAAPIAPGVPAARAQGLSSLGWPRLGHPSRRCLYNCYFNLYFFFYKLSFACPYAVLAGATTGPCYWAIPRRRALMNRQVGARPGHVGCYDDQPLAVRPTMVNTWINQLNI